MQTDVILKLIGFGSFIVTGILDPSRDPQVCEYEHHRTISLVRLNYTDVRHCFVVLIANESYPGCLVTHCIVGPFMRCA